MTKDRHAARSAARTQAYPAPASRATPRLRILVIALALLALTIQVFGVQGHVHRLHAGADAQGASQQASLAGSAGHSSTGARHHSLPGDDDPAKCPFCQQMGQSQQLVACTLALVAFCYLVIVGFVATEKSAPVLLAVRHSWQSRAPPRR